MDSSYSKVSVFSLAITVHRFNTAVFSSTYRCIITQHRSINISRFRKQALSSPKIFTGWESSISCIWRLGKQHLLYTPDRGVSSSVPEITTN